MIVTNVTAGKPKIGGAVYRAPADTTAPTDSTTALAAAFKELGYVSEDGVNNARELNREVIKAWGGDDVLVTKNGTNDTFTFTLIEALNEDVLKTVYGSASITGTLSDGIAVGVGNEEPEEGVWVIDMILRGGAAKRLVIPRGVITEIGEITYADEEAVGYEITLQCLADSTGKTHYEYIKAA